MTATTTLWIKLVRRLGCDGNPLRRRYDRIQAWLVPVAIIVFLALCPLVSAVTGMWMRADNAAAQRAEASWHPVRAVLLQPVPGPEHTDHGGNTWTTWAPATWKAGGRQHTGDIPAASGTAAGTTVTAFLGPSGQVEVPALSARQLSARVTTATMMTLFVLAVVLAVLTGLGRRLLDKRRLAGWETAWLSVGPRWSRQP